MAEYYREISREKGVISERTARVLGGLIPIRHALLHSYSELDYSKLWTEANKLIELWPAIKREVREYLREVVPQE